MRPAHKMISAGRLDSSRVGFFHTSKPLLSEHPNLVLRPPPFRRSQSDSQLLFIPKKGKGISTCQRNSTLETLVSKRPVRSWRRCLPRPARFNQPMWWKTATPDAHEDLLLSKCHLRRKPLQQLNSSMAKKLVVVR